MAAAPGIQAALAGTKPWVRLCSILLFISAALMIVVGGLAGVMGAVALGGGAETAALAIVYPVTGLLYLIPALYLFRYANRIGEYLSGGQEVQLELAIDAQRSFWKFVGILSVIAIVIFVLGIVAAIAIPTMLRMSGGNAGI